MHSDAAGGDPKINVDTIKTNTNKWKKVQHTGQKSKAKSQMLKVKKSVADVEKDANMHGKTVQLKMLNVESATKKDILL